eukprot:TRINITY_DN2211_c0_g1_i4.p1 TRINITY_DN2211_c0_g1~~TRINITY_DN2211_c0_g1_i4.p1  ORF type:complete len:225 (-),score=41.87 TRINITY_DN2211_c0_g1_i4:58-732(-)
MSNLHEYSRADLAQFFHMPITQAAREIGVCATVLKKMCRKNGIPRWPHRKIKSINKMIDTLHQSLPTSTPEDAVSIRFEIETLEKHKEHIMQHPEIIDGSRSRDKKRRREEEETDTTYESTLKKQRADKELDLNPQPIHYVQSILDQGISLPSSSVPQGVEQYGASVEGVIRPEPIEPRISLYPVPLSFKPQKNQLGISDYPLPDWFYNAKDKAIKLQKKYGLH